MTPGVVEPYRKSTLSFEVAGRLIDIVDIGTIVRGPQFDGNGRLLLTPEGKPVRRGEIIARLDDTRYRLALDSIRLDIQTTERTLASRRLEIEQVYSAKAAGAEANLASARSQVEIARAAVTAAEADLDLARTNVERNRRLIKTRAVSQSAVDESEATFRSARAGLESERAGLTSALDGERSALSSLKEARGSSSVAEAEYRTLQSNLDELRNAEESARVDLASCQLRAPFDGRVTARSASKGAYLGAGQSVLELTLQNPMKVIITASARDEARLTVGTRVPIHPGEVLRDQPAPDVATVFEKALTADTGTRTFRVGLILPNPPAEPEMRPGEEGETSVRDLFPVIRLADRHPVGLYVNVRTLVERDGRVGVFRLPRPEGGNILPAPGELVRPTFVPIELAPTWTQIDAWTLRPLAGENDLQQDDVLVLDPGPDDLAGIHTDARRYRFRDGDIVRAEVSLVIPERGFWVPVEAIRSLAGLESVFVVKNGRAIATPVTIESSEGNEIRIAGAGLTPGDPVVTKGAAFLRDGENVRVLTAPDGESTP